MGRVPLSDLLPRGKRLSTCRWSVRGSRTGTGRVLVHTSSINESRTNYSLIPLLTYVLRDSGTCFSGSEMKTSVGGVLCSWRFRPEGRYRFHLLTGVGVGGVPTTRVGRPGPDRSSPDRSTGGRRTPLLPSETSMWPESFGARTAGTTHRTPTTLSCRPRVPSCSGRTTGVGEDRVE